MFTNPTVFFALQFLRTPFQFLRLLAIHRKPTATLKLQFFKLLKISAFSASRYVVEKPHVTPFNSQTTALLQTPSQPVPIPTQASLLMHATPVDNAAANETGQRLEKPSALQHRKQTTRHRRPGVLSKTRTTASCS